MGRAMGGESRWGGFGSAKMTPELPCRGESGASSYPFPNPLQQPFPGLSRSPVAPISIRCMSPTIPGTERRRSSRPRDAECCCVDDLGMLPAARASEVPWWVVGVCAHARARSVVQGQHRAVSPGDVTKTPHCHCCSGLTLFLAFAVHLAALAGPEADLAVWVFLRATKTR